MPDEDRIFIKCDIKKEYDKGHHTKVNKVIKNLMSDVENVKDKLGYDRDIIYKKGCGWDKRKVQLGGKGYSFTGYSIYRKSLICDLEYLGLKNDIGKTAEILHEVVSTYTNDEKDIFKKCDIIWGWKDINFDFEVKEAVEQLENINFYKINKKGWRVYSVECPACHIQAIPIREGIYECPICKKIISYK
nr:MAG: Zn finger protein [uncultured archaeon]